MAINKITIGYAVQSFNGVTGKLIDQYFVSGEETHWENDRGDSVDEPDFETPSIHLGTINEKQL